MKKMEMNVFCTNKGKTFKYCIISMLILISFGSFYGCEDDLVSLIVDPTSLTVTVGGAQDVTIKSGNGGYVTSVANGDVANATVSGSIITIEGVAVGSTTVTVTDEESKTQQITVTVIKTSDLTVDTKTVSIGVDSVQNVTIETGNGGYAITVADETIASATLDETTITITGLAAGSTTITLTDNANKSLVITVTVSTITESDGVAFNTSVNYDMEVLGAEKGAGVGWTLTTEDQSDLTLISRTDFMNNVNTDVLDDDQYDALLEYFEGYCDDPNAFIATGYDGTDLGYSAPCLLLTDTDDPDHAGMKLVTVLSTNIAAACSWSGYTESISKSWAYYDPTDGSLTVKLYGYLGWGFDFIYHRKYTPVK